MGRVKPGDPAGSVPEGPDASCSNSRLNAAIASADAPALRSFCSRVTAAASAASAAVQIGYFRRRAVPY